MLKFLAKRIPIWDYYNYQLKLFVKSKSFDNDIEKASKYYVNKLREMVCEINQKLPIFTKAKWYTPMPFDDKRYVKNAKIAGVSLIDQPSEFTSLVIKENTEKEYNEFGIEFCAWDGVHPPTYPDNFYYHHSFNSDQPITFRDSLNLDIYVPLNFKYPENAEKAFTLEELEQIIIVVNRHYDIIHATLGDDAFFIRKTPKENFEDYYEGDYSVFPHRLSVEWMTVIDKQLTSEQVPEAAKVVPLEKGRTLLMSVSDNYFDSYNPEHVLKANLLELRLQHLGVLRSSFATE